MASAAGKHDDDGFTKAAAMDVTEKAVAVSGEEEDKPAAAADPAVVSRDKKKYRRLPKHYIKSMLALQRPDPFPSSDYLDSLAGQLPPEWIAKQKQEHEEMAAFLLRTDEKYRPLRDRFRRELREKGYVEADESDEYRRRRIEEAREWLKQEWAKMDFTGIDFATPEDDLLQAEGYIDYVDDPEDEILLSSYPDDEEDDDEEAAADDAQFNFN